MKRLLLSLTLILAGTPFVTADARRQNQQEWIVYCENHVEQDAQNHARNNYEIYIMRPDGSQRTRLTTHIDIDFAPDWSPDGTQIAFESSREYVPEDPPPPPNLARHVYDIYTMNADGTQITRLPDDLISGANPAWSPDGTKIAFEAYLEPEYIVPTCSNGTVDIYIYDFQTGITHRATSHCGWDMEPDWSPDGTKIAYSSKREGGTDLYVLDLTRGDEYQLTHERSVQRPNWSPDGTQIVYTVDRPNEGADWWDYQNRHINIRVYDTRTGESRQLTFATDSDNHSPSWSPDGTQIVFLSNRDYPLDGPFRSSEVYVMDADGSNHRRLTYYDEYKCPPRWIRLSDTPD